MKKQPQSLCVFEYIYFARPDSVIDGCQVHTARVRAGSFLALEHPVQADVVIGVPDSGLDAAIGYSRQSGIPYEIGFIKNKYIGRTFIAPGQKSREDKVRIKLNPISDVVRGKRVVLIDDSIVRGTTSARIVKLLRSAGPRRSTCASPRRRSSTPCYYGTDIDSREHLIACHHSVEEISRIIGADSLGYLSVESAKRLACGVNGKGYCTACFDGAYPTEIPSETHKNRFEEKNFERQGYFPMNHNSRSESYAAAGVDITAGYRAVELMKSHIARTMTAGVCSDIGGFGGLFELDTTGIEHPVLVSGTDGVGTKLNLAFLMDKHDTVGIDCVAMCVNDIVCCGAKPLQFLDYIACGKNVPEKIAAIVSGVAEGCVQSGAALIGGETAEMPGFYPADEYDLAGFAVGVVDKAKILDKTTMHPGDVVIALPSSGVHSNGFSLVRKVFDVEHADLRSPRAELGGRSLGEALLAPTKIYVKPMLALFDAVRVKGVSHITGGGFYEISPQHPRRSLCAHYAQRRARAAGVRPDRPRGRYPRA